jgi:hypothetical protein
MKNFERKSMGGSVTLGRAASISLLLGALLLSGAIGFMALYSHFAEYDDTGYMLSLITWFNRYGGLYETTFSQYGPFYSEFYWVLQKILHLPITQDGIRAAVLIFWLAASLLGAWFVFRQTKQVLLAVSAHLIFFLSLDGLAFEPGHPISLLILLAGGLALCLTPDRDRSRWATLISGALLGALFLTKINVGGLAIAAIGTAAIFNAPRDRLGRLLRWAVGLTLCLLPLWLAKEPWPVEARLWLVSLSILTFVPILMVGNHQHFRWQDLRSLGFLMSIGFSVACAIILAFALASGSSVTALVDGIVLTPMRLASAFSMPPPVEIGDPVLAGVSCILAGTYLRLRRISPQSEQQIVLGLRILLLLLLLAWIAGLYWYPTILPFLWIAVLPSRPEQAASLFGHFGRLAITLLAATEFLSLYPVWGNQVVLPHYLGIFSMFLVLDGVIVGLKSKPCTNDTVVHPVRTAWVGIASTVLFTVAALSAVRRLDVGSVRYVTTVPLELPGANLLRVDRLSRARLHFLSENLRNSTPSFLTVPGLNSLYQFAGVAYPSGFNLTMNFALLSREQQESIVTVGRRCRPIALVVNKSLVQLWTRRRFRPEGPLADFAQHECQVVGRVGGYELFSLASAKPLPLTYCAVSEAPSESPENSQRFALTLPKRFGVVSSAQFQHAASGKQIGGRMSVAHVTPDEATQVVAAETGTNRNERYAFECLDAEVIRTFSPDLTLVLVRNSAGDLVATVPICNVPRAVERTEPRGEVPVAEPTAGSP